MSRGAILTVHEISEAQQLYNSGLTWRQVGERLGRDHSGLRRACGSSRGHSESQKIRWSGGMHIAASLRNRWETVTKLPLMHVIRHTNSSAE